jgi:hypothetical protein
MTTSNPLEQAPGKDRSALEQSLIALNEEVLLAYMLQNDTAPLTAVTQDDYFLIGPGGIEPREQIIDTVGNLKVDEVTIENKEIRLYESSALLAGIIRAEGTIMGQPMPPMGYLSAYVRQGEQWWLAARSLTPLMAGPNGRIP